MMTGKQYLSLIFFFFFTTTQIKYFVVYKQGVEELSICKFIIIDTCFFHIKGNLLLTLFLNLFFTPPTPPPPPPPKKKLC
jgi:hypothetical protein